MNKLPLAKWSEHQERIKALIDDIGNKALDPTLYEDINKACSNEWAFLFLKDDTFFILRPRVKRDIYHIDVVVAYSPINNAIPTYLPFILFLARNANAQYLRFYTARKGFNKVAIEHGFNKFGYHGNLAIWRYKL